MINLLNKLNKSKAQAGVFSVFASLVVLFVVGAGSYLYGSVVVDSVKAYYFKPSDDINGIQQNIQLTKRGKDILFATSAQVETKNDFNTSCKSTERSVAILGCYTKDRIYVYKVTDSDLKGAMEVSAAHELLHAGYARLNPIDKPKVDMLIDDEYQKIKNQPDIKQAMQYYAKAEPGQELNELHSIIGTTVKDLSPELEKYYSRYFNDRAHIVRLNSDYTLVFDKLNQQAEQLEATALREETNIKSQSTEYSRDLNILNQDIQQFNRRANNQYYTSEVSFNYDRNNLEQRIDKMEERRTILNQQISQYQNIINQYNKLVIKANQLNDSINGVEPPGAIE